VDGSGLTRRLARPWDRLSFANCFFIQFPLMDCLPAAFPRQVGVQRPLGIIEGVFRVSARAAGCIVRFFHFLHEDLYFRINGRRRQFLLPAPFARQRFVRQLDLLAPASFGGFVQFVQGRIGFVRDLADFAFLKQPGEDRPVHRFGHQCLGFFDFSKFSHRAKTITRRAEKVQRAVSNLGRPQPQAAFYA
jgi:hypothetical protein